MALNFYNILDIRFSLESDEAGFIRYFDRDYALFRQTLPSPSPSLAFSFRDGHLNLQTKTHSNSWDQDLQGHPDTYRLAYRLVLQSIFQAAETFLLLHAGCIAKNGSTALFSGAPGMGKTTLVLKLAEKGCTFLGDDIVPVHILTRQIFPFPRSIWSDRPVGDKSPSSSGTAAQNPRNFKTPIPLDSLPMAVDRASYPLGSVFILETGGAESEEITLDVEIKRDGEKIAAEVEAAGGNVSDLRSAAPLIIRLTYSRELGISSEIRRILNRYSASVWDAYTVSRIQPDFTKEPELHPLSNHEACFCLLEGLKQNWTHKGFGSGMAHSPEQVFIQLNQILDGTGCYKLRVGKLDKMIKLVDRILSE